jgi:tetratricopeptide (TPR) repeat protein
LVKSTYNSPTHSPLGATMTEQLLSRLKSVLSKRAGVALALWGEAGVGKSYTVQKVLRALPCQSLSLHATTPTLTLVQRLPRAKKLPSWATQTLQRVESNDFVEDSRLIDALAANVSALAPFVLHLEDIHELDLERLEVVRQLAQSLQRTKGAALIVTSRVQPPELFVALRCASLTKAESDALLESEFKAALPGEALEWLYNKASGNPLYTLEYLRFLTRQGNLWNDGQSWHWRKPEGRFIPATVEALIELTLAKVSQDAKPQALLQSKSLLPLASNELLGAVSELDQQGLAEASNTLKQHGVFSKDTFAHPLYRELTIQRLPKEKRQSFARRALVFLRADPVQAATFLDDANLRSEEALALLREAVRQAKETNNDVQQGKWLAKMLEYLPQNEQAEVALGAATLLKHNAVTEATTLAALAATLDQKLAPKAVLLQAELMAIQGHLVEAEKLWQPYETTQAKNVYMTGLVRLRGVAHDYSGVVALFESCPECFTSPDAATTQWLVRGLAQLGKLEPARTMIANVKATSDEDKILLLKASSDVAYTQADFNEMERLESDIYMHAKKLGNLRVMDQALFNRALALEGLGRYEERKASLEEAMRVCEDLGDVTAYMIAQRAYGSVLAELGEDDRAEQYLQGARQYLESIDFYTYLLDCETTLSQFYREVGRSYANVLALKHAHAAVACAKRMNNPGNVADALCTLALAQLDGGHIAEAEQSVGAAALMLQGLELQQAQLSLRITKAYLCKAKGQRDEARTLFTLVIQDAVERGALLEEQRLGLELDRLNGDVESARKRIWWFEERGLVNSVTIAKRLFPEFVSGETQPVMLDKIPLRLEVLGTMQFVQNGVTEGARGRKRAEFFAALLEAKLSGRTEVSRLELLDILYVGEDELKAANNLREMVHVLRERLGAEAILTTVTGYALGNVRSDAELFLMTGDTRLWRGAYLEGVTLEQQGSVAESLYLLLFSKVQALLETNAKEATRLGKILLEYDPYNQDYLRLCVQALRSSNNYKSLTRLYAETKARFVEVGETLPESWQAFLST